MERNNKRRQYLLPALSLILFALPPSLLAADLNEVYQSARASDPGLRAAEAARLAAGEAVPQGRAGLLPNVGASASVSRTQFNPRNGGDNSYSSDQNYTLSLSQPLFRWDRVIQYRQADDRVAQAEAEFATETQALMLRVAEHYFAVLGAQDNLRFAEIDRDSTERQLEQASQRFEVGLTAITDVHQAQARADLAATRVILAEDQLASAQEALREISGDWHAELADLRADTPLVKPDPNDSSQWVETALRQNLGLIAAQAGLEVAQAEIDRQRAGHYPTLDLNTRYTYNDSSFGGVFALERNDASIGLELNVPLYQGGAVSSRTREARYRYEEALQRLEQQRRATERQARDAYRGVVSSISQVKAQQQAVTSTETALQAAETGFEVGTRTIVEVLDAQREKLLAERDYLKARYDYLLNSLRLRQAAGTLSESDLEKINEWLD